MGLAVLDLKLGYIYPILLQAPGVADKPFLFDLPAVCISRDVSPLWSRIVCQRHIKSF